MIAYAADHHFRFPQECVKRGGIRSFGARPYIPDLMPRRKFGHETATADGHSCKLLTMHGNILEEPRMVLLRTNRLAALMFTSGLVGLLSHIAAAQSPTPELALRFVPVQPYVDYA